MKKGVAGFQASTSVLACRFFGDKKDSTRDLQLGQGWMWLMDPEHWWLMLMVAVWSIFALMVFVLEPLVVHRLFHDFILRDKERALALAIRLHALALAISTVAIAAGVLGAHGALP